MKIEKMNIEKIIPYENNAKIHTKEQIEQIKNSILQFGNNDPIAIDENNTIIEGHGRYFALEELGYNDVDVIKLTHLDEEKKRAYILVHNKLTMNTDFDFNLLQEELDCLNIDMTKFGFDLSFDDVDLDDFDNRKSESNNGILAEKFLIAPFTIFDSRKSEWLNRTRAWKSLGIKSEVGRGNNLTFSEGICTETLTGTSIFNPTLCEICYSWFSPEKNSKILDPFAGGSVRGIVANKLGYNYIGVDLRKEQIEANVENADEVGIDNNLVLSWRNGNSVNIDEIVDEENFDLVFTCHPYYDLEVYSDNEDDLSNMDYDSFSRDYTTILQKCADKLSDNRFFIVVISDVRDKKGFYRDLTGLTKQALLEKNVYFYNDIIFINQVGSKAMTVSNSMKNRKVGRIHQSVLVFYKGNPKEIQKYFKNELIFKEFDENILEEE